jgi:hypothetical protein
LFTPEPKRNATNKLLEEKIIQEVLPSEAELTSYPGEASGELVSEFCLIS